MNKKIILAIPIIILAIIILVIYFKPTPTPTPTPTSTQTQTPTPTPTSTLTLTSTENYETTSKTMIDKLISGIDNSSSISEFTLKIEKLDCIENSNAGLDIKIKTGPNGSIKNMFGLAMFQFHIPDDFKVNDSLINKKLKVSSKGGLFSNSGVSKITIDDTLVFDNLWVYSENNLNTIQIQKTFFEMLLTLIGLNKEETGTYTIKPGGWFVFQTKDPNTIFKGLSKSINKYHHVPYVPAIRIDKSSYIEGSFNFKSLPFENTSWFPFNFQYVNNNLIINIYPDDLIKNLDKYEMDKKFILVIDKSILSCKVIRTVDINSYKNAPIGAIVTDVTQK